MSFHRAWRADGEGCLVELVDYRAVMLRLLTKLQQGYAAMIVSSC
jgi:hypothetical protein